MLPEHFDGQRVQCPNCSLEFAALATAIPPMEVEPPAPPPEAKPAAPSAEPANKEPPAPANPPVQTAYAPAGRVAGRSNAASASGSIYCVDCGTKFARTEDACPECGHPVQEFRDGLSRQRRRPRKRILQPIQGFLPIIATILIPLGLVLFVGAPILTDGFRRPGPPAMIAVCLVTVAALTELAAFACCFLWLYQAWRVVSRGDEDYSPGLMVGLLFVPFFNFYWMFRATLGLSAALQAELKYVAPNRSHEAGWVPALVACVLLLVPYGQPIAICMFMAWMLIANNAVHRLIRYHDELESDRVIHEGHEKRQGRE